MESTDREENHKINGILMYSGYGILVLFCVILIIFRLCRRKRRGERIDPVNELAAIDEQSKSSVSSSLIFLTSPVGNGLKLEDLLRAPAELLGRSIHGSLYKVMFENGMTLVVKRIKNWKISDQSFMSRMGKIDRVKHRNVLPPLAFYSSKQEKLLVYEYQFNGSLFTLLHGEFKHPFSGIQTQKEFDWNCRVSFAATIAKALAFMHEELEEDGISHGNLKSSNILMNRNMEPCISEYGLIEMENLEDDDSYPSKLSRHNVKSSFRADIYGFGVILLELLTGKHGHEGDGGGVDLTEWVCRVVEEEWTTEVFDKSLISEGGDEGEKMVKLLQVAVQCVNHYPEERPSMKVVASMIDKIKEEEDEAAMFDERSLNSSAEISLQVAGKHGVRV